ncbi:MAG: DUF4270 family protein [Cyclobacteriaceae bacterium]
MNWRDRKNYFFEARKWALIILSPFFLMCEEPNEIGAELNPNDENLKVLYKEFTLPSSVILSDSVATNDPSQLLFGVYNDPEFGRIKVSGYAQLGLNDNAERPPSPIFPDAVFDSVVLHMHYQDFFGENFQEAQRFKIHEISDTLFTNVTYKSTTRAPINFFELADVEFRASPDDTLQVIRLSDNWGEDVMELVRDNQPATKFDPVFQNDIHGLAFVPEDDMDYIVGVDATVNGDTLSPDDDSTIRLHYHRRNQDQPLFFDMSLEGRVKYLRVENDRSGTVLSEISEPFTEFIPFNNKRYVQPATGIYTKIDMSPVYDFIDSVNGFIVNHATFEFGPVEQLNRGDFIGPLTEFSLVFLNDDNKINGGRLTTDPLNTSVIIDRGYISSGNTRTELFESNGDGVYQPQDGNQATNYLQLIGDESIPRTDLVIYPLDFSTLNQLILDANDIKLKVFYTTLQ